MASGSDDKQNSNETRNPEVEIFFMAQALKVAKDALQIGEVPVGCVIVLRDATVIDATTTFHHALIQKNKSSPSYYEKSLSVIISHGSNQVNATRDATRHAEIVAIDRMLTGGRSSDQLKLPPDVIYKSVEVGESPDNNWINVPNCKDHWKNSFGWGSGRVYDKEILSECDLYVTCEPCIMVRKL